MLRRLPAALAVLLPALLVGPAPRPAAASPGELRVAAVQLPPDPRGPGLHRGVCVPHPGGGPQLPAGRPGPHPFPRVHFGVPGPPAVWQVAPGGAVPRPGPAACSTNEPLAHDLGELFLLNSALAESSLRELFGGLARRHGVAIGAGTWFAPAQANGRAVLVDRAVIFDSSGAQLYTQDKVFLTPFEEGILGLRPGRLSDARPFLLKGRRLALTICRDTYSEEWDGRLAGAELWVDLKANGEPFTQAVRGELPARPARTPVRDGRALRAHRLPDRGAGRSAMGRAVLRGRPGCRGGGAGPGDCRVRLRRGGPFLRPASRLSLTPLLRFQGRFQAPPPDPCRRSIQRLFYIYEI